METGKRDTSIKVRLVVTSGKLYPQAISDFLGVMPTKTWLLGERVLPKASNVHKENGWVLSIEGRGDELITEDIIDRLIGMVPQDKLAALCKQNPAAVEVELSVVTFISAAAVPSISLSRAQVDFLHKCSGSFDIDIYLR
jgi:Domain of unknown function (DUF4279)